MLLHACVLRRGADITLTWQLIVPANFNIPLAVAIVNQRWCKTFGVNENLGCCTIDRAALFVPHRRTYGPTAIRHMSHRDFLSLLQNSRLNTAFALQTIPSSITCTSNMASDVSTQPIPQFVALGNGVWLDEIHFGLNPPIRDIPGGSVTFGNRLSI